MVLFDFRPLYFYSTRDGFLDVRGDARYDPACNPVILYLRKNPGKKWVRLEDPLPPGVKIEETPFYKQVMEPEGWRHVIALQFWNGPQLLGWFSPVRSAAQGDFTNAEMALLQQVYPHLEVCYQRLDQIHQQGLTSAEIGSLMDLMPEPNALLDWDLRVLSCSESTRAFIARWNYGESSRVLNARRIFALPDAIVKACEAMREQYEENLRHVLPGAAARFPEPVALVHPSAPHLQVALCMIGAGPAGRGLQHFLLKCRETERDESQKRVRLDLLSPREREIALEVWKGGSNGCIAARLGRDIGTIKKQLTAVYRKLGISTRTELVRGLGRLGTAATPDESRLPQAPLPPRKTSRRSA